MMRSLLLASGPALVLLAPALLSACSGEPNAGSGGAPSSSSSSAASSASTSSAGGAAASSSSSSSGGDVSTLSDTFDGAALDPSWTIFRPEVVSAKVSGSALSLTMTQQALWYQASQGTLVYKLVTGDFKVTSTVRARKTSNPAVPPDINIHLGGLMARNPMSAKENYVFIVVGDDVNDLSVETKTTTDSMSTYDGPSWGSGDAELRLCRVGSDFYLTKRAIGTQVWAPSIHFPRPDLPSTLQVGPNAYTFSAPDLTVTFDEVVFAKVGGVADCEKD